MARLSILAFLAALVVGSAAQSPGSTVNETVWASVAFVMHGERTPLEGRLSVELTPAGAQQMFVQGDAFRSRYLQQNFPLDDAEARITTREPIHGINRNSLDNSQLEILSSADDYKVAGALAFMQGLYPPIERAFGENVGGINISYNAVTGNFTQYPMGGYQYPAVQALSILEERSIFLQGSVNCPAWFQSAHNEFRNEEQWASSNEMTYNFYQQLFKTPPLEGSLPLSEAHFFNAYNVYDFVKYMRDHNETVFQGLRNETLSQSGEKTTVELLEDYAENQQFGMNADREASGLKKGDMIRTIAGMTLGQAVLDAFKSNRDSLGHTSKLQLLFGSFEPMLAFMSLSGLREHDADTASSPWWRLPGNGAVMMFELIGEVEGQPDQYPSPDDLKVRFLYRQSANPAIPFLEYGIFGASNAAHRMPYREFEAAINKVAVNVEEWCKMCDAPVLFCKARNGFSKSGSPSGAVASNPAVAGVIGATVTIAVIGLAALAAFFFLGLRVHKADRNGHLGGFKGAEKMASDTDLAISKGGGNHERVGSWELRGGSNITGEAGLFKISDSATSQTKTIDDDAVSDIGAVPVKPRDCV